MQRFCQAFCFRYFCGYGQEHKEFLRQFGCFTLDRETGKEGLTMAGLLMFGKGLPIRERFDNLRLDYVDKSHLVGDQRYNDRLTYDGTWENNLYNFVTYVLPRLTKELPRPFQMEGVERKDDTHQHKAVSLRFDLLLNCKPDPGDPFKYFKTLKETFK